MVVGALLRQRAGAWLTTTANLWGSLALDKFSAKFESVQVAGGTNALLGDRTAAIDWSAKPGGGSLMLAWPAYEERSFEAFRSYFEYLPKGKHVIEYSVRLNNPGRFSLPPTRVEAMYAPETFGESPNAMVEVAP